MPGEPRAGESWFGAYAILGAVASGMAPLLLPLWLSREGTTDLVGPAMAAIGLGQLAAPLWGRVVDDHRLYLQVFLGGFVVVAGGLAGFVLSSSGAAVVGAALITGAGISACTTVANLYIVERFGRESWSSRLGGLQLAYGAGQVSGLLLAGVLTGLGARTAVMLAAAMPLAGLAFSRALPAMPGSAPSRHLQLTPRLLLVSLIGSSAHALHLLHVGKAITALRHASPTFLRFHAIWFVINTGSAFIFTFYPLLLNSRYGVSVASVAWGYAAAVAGSLLLMRPAADRVARQGAGAVLRGALAVRVVALCGLIALLWTPGTLRAPAALLLFGVIVAAWVPLNLAGTTVAASSGLPEGEAMGLFSANSALTSVVGALAAGWLVGGVGYGALPVAAVLLIAVGWFIGRGPLVMGAVG